ncbi:MAG TPA: hypothetical protein VL727_01595 [Puia sp.]|jgi:hypothetical protein|nr:hypothetical protein [Puia sp.]
MYSISDEQIDFILHDLAANGIGTESLQQDLLDHICIIIEQGLEEGGDFDGFYAATVKTFYKKELREIEEETGFLLTIGHRLVLSRNLFFLLLFILIGGPFVAYLASSAFSSGTTAGWNIPEEVWRGTLVFSLFPMLVLLVLFLTPDRLDPVIPWRSKVLIGIHPFIQIVSVSE